MASPRPVAVSLLLVKPSSSSSSPSTSPRFLLCSSRKLRPDGTKKWVFPKGGIEHGESPKQAAEREAWEEAGLRLNSTLHLTHLLTTHDPAPHILSPSQDPTSPSFVPACRYEFELFLVPTLDDRLIDTLVDPTCPYVDDEEEDHERNPSISTSTTTTKSSTESTTRISPSPLSPDWPESHERTRLLTTGWKDTERRVCWGRREGVMKLALEEAKVWIEQNFESTLTLMERTGGMELGERIEGGEGDKES